MSLLNAPTRVRRTALATVSVIAIGMFGALPFASDFAFAKTDLPAAAAQAENGFPHSFADVVAMDKPAVVTITTEISAPQQQAGEMGQGGPQGMPPDEFFRRFFGDNGPLPRMPGQGMPGQGPQGQAPQGPGAPGGMALGSGFIVSADGYIVTNNHVIDHAKKITVTLDDGKDLPATLVGRDAKNDLAVLKIEPEGKLPTMTWGDSDAARAGDPVMAIGDPFGIGTTVTSGIVSARGRDLHNGPYDDFIQVDAAINHGNSGGPLVDVTGKVIGINTAIYSPNGGNVGVGFAIPSKQAQAVVERIIAGGSIEHGYIGVSIQGVDDQIAGAIGLKDARGALVAGVQDGSPASKAGVKPGDVIVSVNGTAAASPKEVSRMIADLRPGDEAKLGLWRDGRETKLSFAVGQLDSEKVAMADQPQSSQNGDVAVGDLGIAVATLDAGQAQSLGLSPDQGGVVVTSVDANGSAAEKGVAQGDVILSVNQADVASAEDVTKAIGAAKDAHRTAALLLIERQGNRLFVAVPLKDA